MRTKYLGIGIAFEETICWTLANNFTKKLIIFAVRIGIWGIHKSYNSLWFSHLSFKGLSEKGRFW